MTDFGMARDVHQENIYQKKSKVLASFFSIIAYGLRLSFLFINLIFDLADEPWFNSLIETKINTGFPTVFTPGLEN